MAQLVFVFHPAQKVSTSAKSNILTTSFPSVGGSFGISFFVFEANRPKVFRVSFALHVMGFFRDNIYAVSAASTYIFLSDYFLLVFNVVLVLVSFLLIFLF